MRLKYQLVIFRILATTIVRINRFNQLTQRLIFTKIQLRETRSQFLPTGEIRCPGRQQVQLGEHAILLVLCCIGVHPLFHLFLHAFIHHLVPIRLNTVTGVEILQRLHRLIHFVGGPLRPHFVQVLVSQRPGLSHVSIGGVFRLRGLLSRHHGSSVHRIFQQVDLRRCQFLKAGRRAKLDLLLALSPF